MKISKRFDKGITLNPTTTVASIEGEVRVDSASDEVKVYLDGVERTIVTENQVQSLENKTIDVDNNTVSNIETDNLKSGVLNTSTTLAAASNTQVPSALAVKTYVDNSIATVNDASEIAFSNGASGLVATTVQAAIDEVDGNVDNLVTLSGVALDAVNLGTFTGTTIPDNQTNKQAIQALETAHEAHLNDTTDAHAASAITNTPAGNLAATTVQAALNELQGDIDTINTDITDDVEGPASATDEAVARFDGTTGKLLQNSSITISDAGVVSGATQLNVDNIRLDGNVISSTDTNGNIDITPNGTGIIDLNKDTRFFQNVAYEITTDSASTGSNATLATPATKIIRLTNASLASVDMIPAGSAGQQITVINHTGNSVTINDNTGATTGNRILTGQKAALALKDEASLILEYDSTESRWMVIGGTGGSGTAGINYVSANSDFEAAITGYTAYADGAAVIVDATGGSPATTITRSTSSPLRGTASGLWSKTGTASRLGEGFSYNFTIDTADQAKMLEISFDYTVTSAYVDGDMRVYIYDVTNAQVIEPSQRDILANSGQAAYRGYFQAASNSTSYRIAWHISNASTANYDFKLDNVYVGPVTTSAPVVSFDSMVRLNTANGYGSTGTRIRRFTNINNNFGSAITYADSATNGASFTVNENGVYHISYSDNFSASSENFGISLNAASLTSNYSGLAVAQRLSGVKTLSGETGHVSWSGYLSKGDIIRPHTTGVAASIADLVTFTIAKEGRASDSTGNIIGFKARLSANQAIATSALTKITFDTITGTVLGCYNKGSGFSTTNTRFEAPESGLYCFNFVLLANTDITAGAAYTAQIRKNATSVKNFRWWADEATHQWTGTTTLELSKGDFVEVYNAGDASYTIIGGDSTDSSMFEGFKINNPAQIAPTEVVACSYTTDAGATFTDNGIVIFEDRAFDTHNAYNTSTGIYTVPVSGIYEVSTVVVSDAVVAAVTNYFGITIQKQGLSTITYSGKRDICEVASSRSYSSSATAYFSLSQGETIRVLAEENITNAITLTVALSGRRNQLHIKRIK